LIENGYSLLTPKEAFRNRISLDDEFDRNILLKLPLDVACLSIQDPSATGEVLLSLYKIPLAKKIIDGLNPSSNLVEGGLELNNDVYDELRKDSFILDSHFVNEFKHNPFLDNRKKEEILEYLVEGDVILMKDYMQHLIRQHLCSISNILSLWFPSNSCGARLLRIEPISQEYCSNLDLCLDLDDYKGNLMAKKN
ncbi:hypothetical protein KY334_06155, partial [Candidatus Woesearchaeota archaeon]|nr:hypothetical protein [Candidatus Woesearchaeota archaeon]